jgi:hypothetical protein
MQYVVTTKSGALHVRSGAGTNFPITGSLRNGTTVEIIDSDKNGWVRIKGGGFVSMQFLRPPDAPRPKNAALTSINWKNLWDNYPTGEKEDVKKDIGGGVNVDWITNTCTIRISRALNSANSPVPNDFTGLNTVDGVDQKHYAYRVQEMQQYFIHKYGQPTMKLKNDAARKALAGRQGIVVFYFALNDDGATGHIDLWDGNQIRYNDVMDKTGNVLFWEIP